MNTKNGTAGKAFKLSVTTLAIMNITAVVSLRGLPSEAIYGPSSAFYYLFAAIVFLIPTAMVAAELAAMFSDKHRYRNLSEIMHRCRPHQKVQILTIQLVLVDAVFL